MSAETLRAKVAATEPDRQPTLYERIDGLRPYLARAMPEHVDVDAFIVEAWAAIRRSTNLPRCEWTSLAGALLTAAQLGLTFGPLEHAWLIPRQTGKGTARHWEASFQLGYKGALELARRSGRVGAVRTGVIYDWAEVEEVDGTEPRLIVRPIRPRAHDATPVAYWCVVQMLGGADDVWSVLERHEIDRIRDAIPGSGNAGSAWTEHYDAMARVTVFRRLRGMLPLSVELAQAFAADGVTAHHDPTIEARTSSVLPVFAADDAALSSVGDATATEVPLSIADGGPVPDGEPFAVGNGDLETGATEVPE